MTQHERVVADSFRNEADESEIMKKIVEEGEKCVILKKANEVVGLPQGQLFESDSEGRGMRWVGRGKRDSRRFNLRLAICHSAADGKGLDFEEVWVARI